MKLYFNKTSPYARKVRVVAHEKRLAARIQWCETDPWGDPLDLHDATPIGKVPALVTDDGVLGHELRHAFPPVHSHPYLLPWLASSC